MVSVCASLLAAQLGPAELDIEAMLVRAVETTICQERVDVTLRPKSKSSPSGRAIASPISTTSAGFRLLGESFFLVR